MTNALNTTVLFGILDAPFPLEHVQVSCQCVSGFHLGGGGWVIAPLIYSRPFIKVAVVLFLRSNPSFYKTIVLPPLEHF